MKRFLFCLVISLLSFNALSEECQIKPVLKEYPTPKDFSNYPLESKITSDLTIRTPVPQTIAPLLPFYVFGNDIETSKTISFTATDNPIDGYSEKDLHLKAFGVLAVDEKETSIFAYRHQWITCKNLPIEIKLNTDAYRAFLTKRPSKDSLYDLFVIPTSENRFVYSLQFSKFSEKEINEIMGTINFIRR